MTETVAVIDLGTNTFNMLIVEHNFHAFKLIHQQKIAVKLGEGGMNDNVIRQAPYQRALNAISDHLHIANKYGCKKVFAFATSAFRSASNGDQLAKEILDKYDLHIQIVDGDKEAELIYKGVKQAFKKFSGNSLIMDIGGGSTEFILCNQKGVIWQKSYDLGAARLLEWLKPTDPIKQSEVNKLFEKLSKDLTDLKEMVAEHKPLTLIGSSGSFDSLHEMSMHKLGTPDLAFLEVKNVLNPEIYQQISSEVIASSLDQRKKMPGLIAMRVDMIVIATLFIDFILKQTQISTIYQCQYALKEGVLHEIMHKEITY